MANVSIVTDGSAPAVALARWLRMSGVHATVLEGRSAADAELILDARSSIRGERTVALTPEEKASADIPGNLALRVARRWLSALPAIEQRAAADVLERYRGEGRKGHEALEELLSSSLAVPASISRASRGRPKGSNPFSGAGFDVIVAMLCEHARRWSERDLANAIGRSPSAVNRVLRELHRRGYVLRGRGSTWPRDPALLRDDLLANWRGTTARRVGVTYRASGPQDINELLREVQRNRADVLLAGHAALADQVTMIETTSTVYCTAEGLRQLEAGGAQAVPRGMGELVVWEPPERGVFYAPRIMGETMATNLVVTYLDLATSLGDRGGELAQAAWERLRDE